MSAKVFVGNLSYSTTAEDLKQLLAEAGTVTDVYIPTDRESGRPRGFAFATFSNDSEAAKAIELFHQRDVNGRRLNVNAAEERPRGPRPTGGGYGGGPGGPRPYSPGGGGGGGFGGPPRSFGGPGGGGGGGFGGPPRSFGGPGGGGPSRFEADRNAKSGAGPRRFNEKRRPGEGEARPAKPDDAADAGRRAKGGGGSKRWRGDVDDY